MKLFGQFKIGPDIEVYLYEDGEIISIIRGQDVMDLTVDEFIDIYRGLMAYEGD